MYIVISVGKYVTTVYAPIYTTAGRILLTVCCYYIQRKAMKSGNASTLRKGAWGLDEDTLLRKCIHKYGEGKWHLVPQRAGLNRCRKSCRLRWLNYLRPTIKRGEFSADEVDLMMRLHKLLGNRWSLIGGRLPGRTANDVKNYWNTNIQKKLTTVSYQNEVVKKEELIQKKQDSNIATTSTGITTTVVIKPLPRTLSKGTTVPCYNLNPENHMNFRSPDEIIYNNNMLINKPSSPATLPPDHDGIEWWKSMFAEIGIRGQEEDSSEGMLMAPSSGLENMEDAERGLIQEIDESSAPATETTGLLEEDGWSGWSDIWDFLNSDNN